MENRNSSSDDEWEEQTMVVMVNGILDAQLVRNAVKDNQVSLRFAETQNPVFQVNNSLYSGTWQEVLGTNIILKEDGDRLEVVSCSLTTLKTEKALLTAKVSNDSGKAENAPSHTNTTRSKKGEDSPIKGSPVLLSLPAVRRRGRKKASSSQDTTLDESPNVSFSDTSKEVEVLAEPEKNIKELEENMTEKKDDSEEIPVEKEEKSEEVLTISSESIGDAVKEEPPTEPVRIPTPDDCDMNIPSSSGTDIIKESTPSPVADDVAEEPLCDDSNPSTDIKLEQKAPSPEEDMTSACKNEKDLENLSNIDEVQRLPEVAESNLKKEDNEDDQMEVDMEVSDEEPAEGAKKQSEVADDAAEVQKRDRLKQELARLQVELAASKKPEPSPIRISCFHPAASVFSQQKGYVPANTPAPMAPPTIELRPPMFSPTISSTSPTKSRISKLGSPALNVPPPSVVLPKLSSFSENQKNLLKLATPICAVASDPVAELSEALRLNNTKEPPKREEESKLSDDNAQDDSTKMDNLSREKRKYIKKKDRDSEKDDKDKRNHVNLQTKTGSLSKPGDGSDHEEKPLDKKTFDVQMPPFEKISECIYLTKNATKKKTESLLCFCRDSGADCSDQSCVNASMSTECPSGCVPGCKNRRFKKKNYAPVEAFHTGTPKGFGLRATKDIKKGVFIIEYIGEVLDKDDYEKRKEKYASDKSHQHHYLCDAGIYTIDATKKGNISRFINHSCEPNAVCEKWSVPKTPGDVSRIGFFSTRDIAVGEEITFDYRFVNYGRDAQKCHCGAPSCNGWIGTRPEGDSDSEEEEEEEVETDEEELESGDSFFNKISSMQPDELKEEIQSRFDSLIFNNKKHSHKIMQLASYMVDYDQKMAFIEKIFSSDSPLQTQLMYASSGMTRLLVSWLTHDDFSVPSLKLKQKIMQVLHNDAFLPSARADQELLSLVSALAKCPDVPPLVEVQCVGESLISAVSDQSRPYEEHAKTIAAEIQTNYERFQIMTVRLNNHWFNRSVNFRIPKKIREPEKEKEKDFSPPVQENDGYWKNRRYNGNYSYNFFPRQQYSYKRPYYRSDYRQRSRSRTRSCSPKRKRTEEFPTDRHRKSVRAKSPEALERPTPPSSSCSFGDKAPPPPQAVYQKPPAPRELPTPAIHPHLGHQTNGMIPVPHYPTPMHPYEMYNDWCAPNMHMSYGYYPQMNGYHPMEHHQMLSRAVGGRERNPSTPKESPPLTKFSLPKLEDLGTLYDSMPLEDLKERLEVLNKELHMLHKKIVLKEECVSKIKEEKKLEEARKQSSITIKIEPPPPPSKYVWAKALCATGETYYYNKVTKETQWDPPRGDQGELDPNDRTPPPVCDTTAKEDYGEENDSDSKSDVPLSSRAKQVLYTQTEAELVQRAKEEADREAARQRVQQMAEDEEGRKRAVEAASKAFKLNLEKVIKPIVKKNLEKIPDATPPKIVWLVKLLVKEMYKRESSRSDFDYKLNDTSYKMVKKYTETLMERKLKTGVADLWKGYK
ncbi:unnamed protein product [Caenorhabditis auriculariae]|uniref:Histone-lysine N-methyltransferase n=1 Tax=Caenorhabditis auriculariae TaxID=2777116 RepID=A0A8S1GLZ9_9PELO|nr:unnamed protein product [Caenorhabditis auriculariae]